MNNQPPKCPCCGGTLEKVTYSGGYLNREQWDDQKAGDYVCKACPDNGRAANKQFSYFWESELAVENKQIKMKVADILARRKELAAKNVKNYLTENEHQELHKLSQDLIDKYKICIDITEISDEDLENQDGFQ